MAAIRHLGFFKLIFWTFLMVRMACISLQNFVEIGQTIAEILQFIHFFKMAAIRHVGYVLANFGMIHNDNLMVFITVQNFVAIALVVMIIQMFEYFAHLAWKMAIHAPFLAGFDVFLHATRCNNCVIIAGLLTWWKMFMKRKCCSHEYFPPRQKACNIAQLLQRVACNKLHMKSCH